MIDIHAFDQYLSENLETHLLELAEFCSFPSVCDQPEALQNCALFVERLFQKRGFKVEKWGTGDAPVIFAEKQGKSPKTLLFYNHYDVQPAEQPELWESPPFKLTRKGDRLFARGVNDDKGHLLYRLYALDALLALGDELPCSIKFLIDGEEETSSANLAEIIEVNKLQLVADACIWEFGGVDHRDIPLLHLGVRGICSVELIVETAKQDVHSGVGGSIFPNAAWRLVWALGSLKGVDENIRIPGFYHRVRQPSSKDRFLLEAMPEVAEEYKEQYGISQFLNGITGGAELRQAELFEPSCTINSITAGYQGEGLKTIVPHRASAKLDFRLVPDQEPEKVVELLIAHLHARGFPDVQIRYLGGDNPQRTEPDHPFVRLMAESSTEIYGAPMQVVPLTGSSGPNYLIADALKIPIVSHGISDPAAAIHAPNENVRPDLYLKGAKHLIKVLDLFSLA